MTTDDQNRSDAFETFARSNRLWLRREAYKLCGDWDEAEDLVQILLHKLYSHWERLTHHDQLAAYSRRALLRTYVSQRRRGWWSREVVRPDPPESSSPWLEHSPDDRLMLLAAIKRLAPRQRAVVVLRFWYDLSIADTARILDCSPGTVRSQTFRALHTLRAVLADD